MSYCPQHGVYLPCRMCKPAPAAAPQPEMLEGPDYIDYRAGNTDPQLAPFWLHLPRLRTLLATQGLTIVGPTERAVLDACEALEEYDLKYWVVRPKSSGKRANLAEAELARRAGPAERAAPQPGDPVYGAPDAGLSLVPREPGAKPVAEVESYDEVSGKIVLRGLSPSTITAKEGT